MVSVLRATAVRAAPPLKILPLLPGADPSIEAVIGGVRAALGVGPLIQNVSVEALAIARENRVAMLLLQGLDRTAEGLSEDVAAAFEEFRQLTISLNTKNLMTLRRVLPVLEAASIPVLLFKGPVSQQASYGSYFVKPSSDVDLLVSNADFDRARSLLDNGAHALAKECRSFWWRTFLGEQHLLSLSPAGATIDLHHRVQQPGSVSPLKPERFLGERTLVTVAGMRVPTLSPTNAMLLSCMSLTKALVHREAAGGHVADLAARWRGLDDEQYAALVASARVQGLELTLAFSLRCARLLFGVGPPTSPQEADAFGVSSLTLAQMILTPGRPNLIWPKRRRMLWDLCDVKLRFGREAAWAMTSEFARRASGG